MQPHTANRLTHYFQQLEREYSLRDKFANPGQYEPPAPPEIFDVKTADYSHKCAYCGKPATCYGSSEGQPPSCACDDCCGHGNEDGWCDPLCWVEPPFEPEQVYACTRWDWLILFGLAVLDLALVALVLWKVMK